jgi:hypothetical protein
VDTIADGGVMAGNTRVLILQERGVDVNSLSYEEYTPWGMTDLKDPVIPQLSNPPKSKGKPNESRNVF